MQQRRSRRGPVRVVRVTRFVREPAAESPQVLPRRGRNPLPYFQGHAYRFGENLVYAAIVGTATSGFILASANTRGWHHLLGVAAAMSGSLALAQGIGSQLGRPRNGFVLFLSVKWLFIGYLFGLPILFAAIGVSLADATVAFAGAGVGLLLHLGAWYLGVRYLYRPQAFPRWWFRLTLQGFAFAGAVAALAVDQL